MNTWKSALLGLVVLTAASVIFLSYYALSHDSASPAYKNDFDAYIAGIVNRHDFFNLSLFFVLVEDSNIG